MSKPPILIGVCSLLFIACQNQTESIHPKLDYAIQDKYLKQLEHPFSPLSHDETLTEWGKEYRIAHTFAKKLDLYTAIQTFKRAEILIPPFDSLRLREIQYEILFCYYIGKKYNEVIDTFEHSTLVHADDTFVAYKDLLTILFESYYKIKADEKAKWILHVIERHFPSEGRKLALTHSLYNAEIFSLKQFSSDPTPKRSLEEILSNAYHRSTQEIKAGALHLISHAYEPNEEYTLRDKLDSALVEQVKYLSQYAAAQDGLSELVTQYEQKKKSPNKAKLLNVFIPGAGYLYVGQKQTAVTSFLINSLFIWGATHFFQKGNIPLGIITTSFELGWYIGGIQGASSAATLYNERLYETYAHNHMRNHRLYPTLMLTYGF